MHRKAPSVHVEILWSFKLAARCIVYIVRLHFWMLLIENVISRFVIKFKNVSFEKRCY